MCWPGLHRGALRGQLFGRERRGVWARHAYHLCQSRGRAWLNNGMVWGASSVPQGGRHGSPDRGSRDHPGLSHGHSARHQTAWHGGLRGQRRQGLSTPVLGPAKRTFPLQLARSDTTSQTGNTSLIELAPTWWGFRVFWVQHADKWQAKQATIWQISGRFPSLLESPLLCVESPEGAIYLVVKAYVVRISL
jgi:hypothetical protein